MKTNLKKLRKDAGWSNAADFAKSIGMPAKTYRNYEQGVRKMGLDVASEICNALGCSINDLVDADAFVDLDSGEFYLPDDEMELVSLYRRMDDADKTTLMNTARTFVLAGETKKENAHRVTHGVIEMVRS